MQCVLRDYRDDDIPTILKIIKSAFSEQRGLVDPPSSAEQKTIEIIREELITAKAIMAVIGNTPVGCVFYQPRNGSIYIDRLSVLSRYRKRGIGRALMEEAEKRAVGSGYKNLSLSVRIELKKQQSYYENMGYRIVSEQSHEGYDRPTYVVMEKHLE